MKTKNELLISISSEISDLQLKIDKLSFFIKSSDFLSLDSVDRDYLLLQRHSMLIYSHVLVMRLERILNE